MPLFSTTPRLFGGFAMDRAYFRTRLPDFRWVLRVAGIIDPRDASNATVTVGYVDNAGTFWPLTGGSTIFSGAGTVKFTMGPILLFNPVDGYAMNEQIPVVRLRAAKSAGVAGELGLTTLWVEQQSGRM